MRKVKIGCVGLRRGKDIIKPFLNNEMAELVAICDINPEALKKAENEFREMADLPNLKTYTSYEEFLKSDAEAIVLATPATNHTYLVKQAMEAGKHVLSEIPAVASLEEAKVLKEIVHSYPKLKYMSGENCCFFEFVETWKKMYEDGLIGDVFYAEADYIHDCRYLMEDENGELTWRAHLDAIKYLTHDVGVLLYLMDDEVESVSCFTPKVKVTPKSYTGASNQIGIFRTKKGAVIKMFAAFAVNVKMSHNYSLYGTKGTLERDRNVDWVKADTFATLTSIPNVEYPDTAEYGKIIIPIKNGNGKDVHGGCDTKMMEAFVKCVRDDTHPPIDVEMGIKMSLPGIYAAMSAKQGGITVDIPEI